MIHLRTHATPRRGNSGSDLRWFVSNARRSPIGWGRVARGTSARAEVRGSRPRWFGSALGSTLVLSSIALAQSTPPPDAASWNDTYRRRFAEIEKGFVAISASRCGGTTGCHLGSPATPDKRFLGTEHDLWFDRGQGAHQRALRSLDEDPRSARMTEILYGPETKPQDTPQCRACHTLDVPPELRGVGFEKRDGVSCENCHGRAERWGSAHYSPKWRNQLSTDDRTDLGFYDTIHLVRRAEKCLECHLGTESKQVTHNMLAAGHPPLTFELASDLNGVPKHWKDANSYLAPDEGPWFNARVWAVGQAVLLRESMDRLAHSLTKSGDFDFALFECYACHHDLRDTKQLHWRQGPGLDPSRLGQPAWESSAFAMCRPLVDAFLPELRPVFERSAATLNAKLRITGGDRAAAISAAKELAAAADRLAAKLNATRFDRAAALGIVRALVRDRDDLAVRGYRTAVQVDYALHALNGDGLFGRPRSASTTADASRAVDASMPVRASDLADPSRPGDASRRLDDARHPPAAKPAGPASAKGPSIEETVAKLCDLLHTERNTENAEEYDGLRFAELLKQLESQLPEN